METPIGKAGDSAEKTLPDITAFKVGWQNLAPIGHPDRTMFGIVVPCDIELVVYEDKAGYHGFGMNMTDISARELCGKLQLAIAASVQGQKPAIIMPNRDIVTGANGG